MQMCFFFFSFLAPETQTQSVCSILSDMFSLGMVICAIFNNGRPLIQAGNSSSAYLKQLELVSYSFILNIFLLENNFESIRFRINFSLCNSIQLYHTISMYTYTDRALYYVKLCIFIHLQKDIFKVDYNHFKNSKETYN